MTTRRSYPALWPATEAAAIFGLMMLYIWVIHGLIIWFPACILALVIASHALRGEGCASLGFCWATFTPTVRALWPAVAALAAVLALCGYLMHSMRKVSVWTVILGFLLYCLWGLLQQYLLNGFLLNRLVAARGGPAGQVPVWIAAGAFSLIHAPNWFLMAVTLPAGYLCGLAYLKFRNLPALGLAHALLGMLIYLMVPDSISHGLYVGPSFWAAGHLSIR